MKSVLALLTLAILVTVNAQTCPVRTYTEYIIPGCSSSELSILLPDYTNAQNFYSCDGVGNPVLKNCPVDAPYFTYVFQQCTTCENYIPAVTCEQLLLPSTPNCQPITNTPTPTPTATSPPVTTALPTGSTSAPPDTTTSTTTTTTTTTTTQTSSIAPTPPTENVSTETSVVVPGPPVETTISSNIIGPSTPLPTPPVYYNTPPNAR